MNTALWQAALDTSGPGAWLALAKPTGERPPPAPPLPLGRDSAGLLGALSHYLASHGLKPRDIGQWTVGLGPGSYTGIRVGAALVKGICLASGAAYRGLPSSLAMVQAVGAPPGTQVWALHDGRRQEVLVRPWRWGAAAWEPVAEPMVMTLHELPTAMAAAPARGVVLAGDPRAAELMALLGERLSVLSRLDLSPWLQADPAWPWPATVAAMEASMQPVYVRPPVFVTPRAANPA